jgi:hypothetical protein
VINALLANLMPKKNELHCNLVIWQILLYIYKKYYKMSSMRFEELRAEIGRINPKVAMNEDDPEKGLDPGEFNAQHPYYKTIFIINKTYLRVLELLKLESDEISSSAENFKTKLLSLLNDLAKNFEYYSNQEGLNNRSHQYVNSMIGEEIPKSKADFQELRGLQFSRNREIRESQDHVNRLFDLLVGLRCNLINFSGDEPIFDQLKEAEFWDKLYSLFLTESNVYRLKKESEVITLKCDDYTRQHEMQSLSYSSNCSKNNFFRDFALAFPYVIRQSLGALKDNWPAIIKGCFRGIAYLISAIFITYNVIVAMPNAAREYWSYKTEDMKYFVWIRFIFGSLEDGLDKIIDWVASLFSSNY